MNHMTSTDLDSVAAALQGDAVLCDDVLSLRLGDCSIRMRSNSPELIAELRDYFSHVVVQLEGVPDIEVIAIEREVVDIGLQFTDWTPEQGKTRLKDAFYDLPGGRLVRKVRTGMLFLQSKSKHIAAGPCRRYPNQVINFLNAQYMNLLQHHKFLICHAAGLVCHGQAFGVAGFSGGGKSTLMLRLLNHREVKYLTNDRLFIRATSEAPLAIGIAKLPRVNPGTIVYNPRLQGMINREKRDELLSLPTGELWKLEEKYDVDVAGIYGPDRLVHKGQLCAFLVLNWDLESREPPVVAQVDLAKRRDLLGAIMKPPGPFYQYPDGTFYQDRTPLNEESYLDGLLGVAVYEVRGGVDFDAVADTVTRKLLD